MAYLVNQKFRQICSSAVLAPACLLTIACAGPPPSRVLHTTISSDGRMLATLEHAGTQEQILRVRNLDTDTQWRTVTVPQYTETIQFGLQGYELLLTHRNPATPLLNYLSKLDLSQPEPGLQSVYEAAHLAFPVEVLPGLVMVRTRIPPGPNTHRLSGYYWILVGPEQSMQIVGPETVLPYPAPNIVGSGFFWVEDKLIEHKATHPKLLKYALPGGVAPDKPSRKFDKNTYDISCDRRANRGLRTYISNLGESVKFIYDIEVFLGRERYRVPGVTGFSDAPSITPDGSAAVMSLAPSHEHPRHVVVMHFDPRQCAPRAVQHIYFDEASS